MAMAHVISFGETMLRFTPPTGTRLEQAEQFTAYVAGAESNALACLARLGLHATWISALPSIPLGRAVEAALRGHGVDLSRVVWRSESERLGIFYAEESPAPIGTHVHYDRTGSACACVDLDSLDLSGLEDAQLLYLTGITPALGERTSAVFSSLLQFAEESGIPLAFDVNYRAKLWSPSEASESIEAACRQASVIICTGDDAAALWGFTGEAEAVLRRISSRFGEADTTLVLTLGSGGAAELKSGVYSYQAAMPAEGTYRFGSGDAFAAGYIYAHLCGEHYRNLKEEVGATPLLYGNALAALKRGIAGDIAVVTPYDVKAAIMGRGRFR
jgi:2-dehydro-3-deoxygluconokinase